MDIPIMSIAELALTAMESIGIADSTIGINRKYFRYLENACPNGCYSKEHVEAFASVEANPATGKPYSPNVIRSRKRVAEITVDWVESGQIDLSPRRRNQPQPMPVSPNLLDTLKLYARSNESRGLAKGTCEYYWRLAREYTLHLENSEGISNLDNATPASIFSFLSDIFTRWSGSDGKHIITNFRPFLRFLNRLDLVSALKMADAPKRHAIVPTLSGEDEEVLVEACCRRLVDARNAAITLLALSTGLRACDIIALKISDIDWHGKTISIIQEKTENPLRVPLVPAVADALVEYLLEERPDTNTDIVFVSKVPPHLPFADHAAVHNVITTVFKAAGKDKKAGTLLLRHNAASKMLQSGVELPTISAVLGHASPDTTNNYLETNLEKMRECVLPLPKGALR